MSKGIDVEKSLKRLEKIVQELEDGDLTLDDALKKYREGIELSRTCTKMLKEAKSKVEEYKKRGCTCPILYPVGGNFKLLIDTFARK